MTETQLYDDNWDDWADMKTFGPASRWLRYLIRRTLQDSNELKFDTWLDVGCGEGTNTGELATLFPGSTFKGIDFSSTAIKIATRLHPLNNLSFEVDPESCNLDQKYDVISCFEVLEHVEDWRSLLGRIANASNRYILTSFPTGRMRPFEVNVGHVRNFKPGEVESFLLEQGFHSSSLRYAGFPFYSPIYRELCNLTNAATSNFTQGKYGFKQKFVANALYLAFRCSSSRKYGDQFVGLFERT